MATKPTNTVRWADVSGSITEPASGKKDVGWESNEVVAHGVLNWFLNLYHQWILWLDAFADELHTWTRKQTIAPSEAENGLVVTGGANNNAIEATAGSGTGGHGVLGVGTGIYNGLIGQGGPSHTNPADGAGVQGTGGATAGSPGVYGTGGAGGGNGVAGFGVGTYSGVTGTGGAGGNGVHGTGGTGNTRGVRGDGTGTGAGGYFTSAAGPGAQAISTSGPGLTASSSTNDGIQATSDDALAVWAQSNNMPGVWARCANHIRGDVALDQWTSDPSAPENGDIWVRSDTSQLCIQVGGTTKRVTLS
jgi:hypothetical protein